MLLELRTGRTRPMRPNAPLFSSVGKPWDGVLVEEHAPAEWESKQVTLLNTVVFLTLDKPATLQWKGEGKPVSMTIRPGKVSILPASRPYSVKLRTGGRSLVVSLEQQVLSCAAATLGKPGFPEAVWGHGMDDSFIRELVLTLREEMLSTDQESPRYVQILVATLAAHIVRHHATDRLQINKRAGGLSATALQKTVKHIQRNVGEGLSLDELAAVAGLSTCHFARMFKLATGLSPHDYVLHCRIARARELLLNQSLSLAEVALQAGFCDQGHMTRRFRQMVGATPGAFVRDHAGQE